MKFSQDLNSTLEAAGRKTGTSCCVRRLMLVMGRLAKLDVEGQVSAGKPHGKQKHPTCTIFSQSYKAFQVVGCCII